MKRRRRCTVNYDMHAGDVTVTGVYYPYASLTKDGKRTRLWIGENGRGCIGTIDGWRLRKLARDILKGFGEDNT